MEPSYSNFNVRSSGSRISKNTTKSTYTIQTHKITNQFFTEFYSYSTKYMLLCLLVVFIVETLTCIVVLVDRCFDE